MVRTGDKEKAIEILNRGLKETKNSPQILWFKVNFLIDLRNLDEAREAIKQLETTQYPKFLIDYVDARMAFAQKVWSEAARRFEKLRPSLISMPMLLNSWQP